MTEKLTVPLPLELRAFVAQEAEREDRSQAAIIRRLVAAEAARKARESEAA